MSDIQQLGNIVLDVEKKNYNELSDIYKLFQYIIHARTAYDIVRGIEVRRIRQDSDILIESTLFHGIVLPFTMLSFLVPKFIPSLFNAMSAPMMDEKGMPEKKPGYMGVLDLDERTVFHFEGNSFRNNQLIDSVLGDYNWHPFTAQQKKQFLFEHRKYREEVILYSRLMMDYSIERNKRWNHNAKLFTSAQELAGYYREEMGM